MMEKGQKGNPLFLLTLLLVLTVFAHSSHANVTLKARGAGSESAVTSGDYVVLGAWGGR